MSDKRREMVGSKLPTIEDMQWPHQAKIFLVEMAQQYAAMTEDKGHGAKAEKIRRLIDEAESTLTDSLKH